MPKVANGIDLDWAFGKRTRRISNSNSRRGILPKKPGVIQRVLVYANHANMGVYRKRSPCIGRGIVPTPDITNHAWRITHSSMASALTWSRISPQISGLCPTGWDDGQHESFAYTEVDQTVSSAATRRYGAVASPPGSRWNRLRFQRASSKDHQNYLADGGLGFLLGDGHLTYGRENIIEAYYTVHVWRGVYLATASSTSTIRATTAIADLW